MALFALLRRRLWRDEENNNFCTQLFMAAVLPTAAVLLPVKDGRVFMAMFYGCLSFALLLCLLLLFAASSCFAWWWWLGLGLGRQQTWPIKHLANMIAKYLYHNVCTYIAIYRGFSEQSFLTASTPSKNQPHRLYRCCINKLEFQIDARMAQ